MKKLLLILLGVFLLSSCDILYYTPVYKEYYWHPTKIRRHNYYKRIPYRHYHHYRYRKFY